MPREGRDLAYLDDIKECCALVAEYLRGKNFADFASSRSFQDSVVHRLYLIGEAAKNVGEATRSKYPVVEWRDLTRLRDRLAHHYWSISIEQIWNIASRELPDLLTAIS